jgi:hypothetical protein
MQKEEAEVISFKDLTGGSLVGGNEEKEKEELEKDLEDSLSGKKESTDLLDQIEKEEEDQDSPKPNKSEEEEEDEDPPKPNKSEEEEDQDPPKPNKSEEEEEDEDPPKPSESANFYRETAKQLFGEDQKFIQENDEGEEVEVTIDELDVDADTLKDLIQNKIEAEKEKALEGKISSEGISEMTMDLIEIERNGGQIRDLLQYKDAYTDPLDNLDLSTEEGQIYAIELYLRGHEEPEDEIQIRIDAYKQKGILEEKATQFEGSIRERIKNVTEERKKQALEQKKEKDKLFKEYRKELGTKLKERFQLKDSVIKKLVTNATKKDEKGEYKVDSMYKAARSNPEDMAMLSLFLEDREEFIRQLSAKDLNERRIKDQKAIRLGSRSKDYSGEKKKREKGDDNTIFFDELN